MTTSPLARILLALRRAHAERRASATAAVVLAITPEQCAASFVRVR